MNRLDTLKLAQLAHEICSVGRTLHEQGWTPATSSNFSMKLDNEHCAITVSGKHKGRLQQDDIMVVDFEGQPTDARKPSAETLLHTQLYTWRDDIQAVLHTHSPAATLLSMQTAGDALYFEGYELQKAFAGQTTHEARLSLPIFDNSQNIPELAEQVAPFLKRYAEKQQNPQQQDSCPAYLIRGHGIYTWGQSMTECERHLEALEFLLSCELQARQLRK